MRLWLFIAAVNGFLAVAAGAFAAHALQARLDADSLQLFETGARYHIYHALALGLTALAMRPASAPATLAAASFLAGIILFCGSLYALSLTGARVLAFITPVGGLAFLLGWAALAWAAVRTTA